MVRYIFHEDRAVQFIETILKAYYTPTHLYKHVHHSLGHAPQQRFLPSDMQPGSYEHSVLLCGTTLTDYMSVSYDIFNTANYLWKNSPQLFTDAILHMSPKDVATELKMAKSTFPYAKALRWLDTFSSVYQYLDGDPRKIFTLGESIDEVNQARERLSKVYNTNFLAGLGPKLLSLLSLHYFDFGILNEHFPGSFPADRHIQRQVMQCGILEFRDGDTHDAARVDAEIIRENIVGLCKEMNVSVFDLAHAMWINGNRLCYQCHEMISSHRIEKLRYCALRGMCAGGVQTRSYQLEGVWKNLPSHSDDSQIQLL